MTVQISVEGAQQIERHLSQLHVRLRGTVLRRALRKAAGAGRNKARRMAPKGDGLGGESGFPDLKKSVKSKVVTPRGQEDLVIAIVGTDPEARQASLVEFGHKMVVGGTIPSGTPARVREASDPEKTGKGRVIGNVEPHPWFRPSYEASKPEIERIVIDELGELADATGD